MVEAAASLKTCRDMAEEGGTLTKDFNDQIEEALEVSETTEIVSTQRLDEIAMKEKEERKNVSQ